MDGKFPTILRKKIFLKVEFHGFIEGFFVKVKGQLNDFEYLVDISN